MYLHIEHVNLLGERQKHFRKILFWAHSHALRQSERLWLRLSSCCCCLCEVAVDCKRSGSAGHPMNFSAASFALLHSDAAGSQEWLMPMAVSSNGSGRALYSGGNRRSRLGEELPELHRLTFWECESGPLAMPPALLSQLRTDAAAGFVTRSVFVFQYRFLKDRRQGCFHNSWAKPLQSSAVIHITWFILW